MTTGPLDRARTTPSAGRVLAVLPVLPALAVAGWLLAGLPLLLLGAFRPLAAVPLGLVIVTLLCRYGLRRVPEIAGTTARQVASVVAVALGSGIFNGLLHGEQLIVRRDPGTYAQYALWLAGHGSLPVPRGEWAFGGADPALRFDSVGFYDFGGAVVPQFMPGAPMLHAAGAWAGDIAGMLLVPPLLGAAAVLVVGGMAARLIGPRWAWLAALLFAVCLPILYTSRTTFSEIPSLILIFGGLALLHDALPPGAGARSRAVTGSPPGPGAGSGPVGLGGADPGRAAGTRGLAGLAGLVIGLAVMVRIDGLRDLLPVLAYAGLLIARGRAGEREAGRAGVPLLGGLVAGAGLGLAAAYLLSRPYLRYLSGSLVPLLVICGAVVLLIAVAAALAPRLAGPVRRAARVRWLPGAASGLVVLAAAAFAVRPWLQTVTRRPTTPEDRTTSLFIAAVQKANGLPTEAYRLYYENSAHWVAWYVGIPAALLAVLAAAVLARRLVRGTAAGWALPLAVVLWTTAGTLYRPAITPDHPWAARRLVPVIIPGLVLLAVWGLRHLRDRARRSGYGPAARRRITVGGAVLLLAFPVITSAGTAFTPVERGERAAVEALCAALPARASVLVAERVTADRFTQVVRGTCDVPTARIVLAPRSDVPAPADVARLAARVRAAGRVPVLLAAKDTQLSAYGMPVQVMNLRVRQDERSLVDAPNATWSLSADVWMAVPAAGT
ncbi:hypothetical protein ACIBCT_04395 [Streptosporangium sp. NPDC050855]|uniref:hypothetical protein n=1 Tax=Streptosporangium sp. NPDC050855 TaxID=3366194 RepID=UPI0037915537